MEKNIKILDTNVLLDFPQIVTKYDEYFVIPYVVLMEIDGLKLNKSAEVAQKARKAAVYIAKNMVNIEWDMTQDFKNDPDGVILEIAKKRDATIITNDVSFKVRAEIEGAKVEGYSWKDDYTGIVYMNVSDYDMPFETYNEISEDLLTNGYYDPEDYQFSINEYLIVPPYDNDATYGKSSVYKFDGGRFHKVPFRGITNQWLGEIYPRNDEQICLIDALLNDVPIIYAGGKYGTGKTFLTHNYAIGELEKEHIKKIIYVPNNSYTQNTMDLGALPGDLMEKILPSIGPLVDLVGIDQINRWISEEKLEVVPVAYIRGRNFDDSIVLVSEAENLTEEHIKLLLARCGNNTKIFFDGDIHQADSAIFKDRNGLKLLLNLHNSPFANKFSTVQLVRIERSEVAATADYLDTI